ncbi:MAG: D-glycero-beta-D-manno-heptose 1-phosphate adenylyltransferase [Fidelibacterota bacterium]
MAVISQEEMAVRAEDLRRQGQVVVFTNGCFDLLHRGHIELLERARGEGDRLFVGVNGDDSVRRLKGEGRPFQSAADRAAIVDALAAVDDVAIFHDDTPEELIRKVKPQVLVKGGDYEGERIVGAALVKSWGGKVVTVPLVPGRGTSLVLQKILSSLQRKNG